MTPEHSKSLDVERHVVLVHPDIHWNTGNIGRTCLGTDTTLHLIEPLGFSIDNRFVKRAGLDYWDAVKLYTWKNYRMFENRMIPQKNETCLFTKRGSMPFWSMPRNKRLFLVFGSETRGLPDGILSKYAESTYYIPTKTAIRSLNLSTAVGIVLYESLRTVGFQHEWPTAYGSHNSKT